MVLLTEQCAEQKKVHLLYCCMLHLSAKRHRFIVWWEDALRKTFWATILRSRYSIWFIGWILPFNCEGSVANPSIWKESLTWIVPRIRSVRGGEFGRVTYWSQTLRSWRWWTHRKSTRKDSMRKRWYFPNKENFIFPNSDGRIKTPGGDQDLRTFTLVRHRPIQGDSDIDFLGESEGSLPQPQDSFPDAGEAKYEFWSMSGSFIYRHHVEPRVKLYSPREESFPIQLKYIDVSRTTHTNLNVKQEKGIDDYWNIDGSRDLSDPWTGFTQFTLLDEKAPDGYMWSGWRLTRKQLTSRPDHLWPELWKSMGKHAKLKEKQKWSEEKIHLDNARKLRGIYFIDPEDKEYKETIKNARKKWETSVGPAMPCKIRKIVGVVHPTKLKQNLRVFWKLMNPQECVWEIRYRIIMKTILQEKETIHYSTTIWFTNLFLCFKLWTFLQQKQRWRRNGKMQPDESQKQERSDRWSKDVGRYSSFCIINGHLSSEKCWIGGKTPKIQRSSCAPLWYCKRRLRFLCSIHWTRIFSISNDSG